MGGLGSGRPRQYHVTDECIPIDTMHLLKQKLLSGKNRGATMTYNQKAKVFKPANEYTATGRYEEIERTHSIHILVEQYDQDGIFSRWDAIGHATIEYAYSVEDESKGKQVIDLPLVVTHPNYGGVRYWFLAPCCGERVRIVYLPTFGEVLSLPSCRKCLDLNYISQRSSYIERHITREKYLLANYGYTWAEDEYWQMKIRGELYFKVTPEYREKQRRSELEVQLHFIKLLMSFNRLMLNDHIRAFRTLRSIEDRHDYLEHALTEWGTGHALAMLTASRGHVYALPGEIEGLIQIINGQPVQESADDTMDDHRLSLLKAQYEDELEWLDQAA